MPDKNLESYADRVYLTVEGPRTLNGNGYDDALKLSNCLSVIVKWLTIIGGREDCVDINRGKNIVLHHLDLYSGGQYCMTIKGGVSNVVIRDCIIFNPGTVTDIDIGNWSDQSGAMTPAVTIDNVKRADGKPVRVRVLHGEAPYVLHCDCKVKILPPLIVWGFRLLKRWHIIK